MILEEWLTLFYEIEIQNTDEQECLSEYLSFKGININELNCQNKKIQFPCAVEIRDRKAYFFEGRLGDVSFCYFMREIMCNDFEYWMFKNKISIVPQYSVKYRASKNAKFGTQSGFISHYFEEKFPIFSNNGLSKIKIADRSMIQELLENEYFDGFTMELSEVEIFHDVFKQIPYVVHVDTKVNEDE